MKGDELLQTFLKFVNIEKPQRFFQYHDRLERPQCFHNNRYDIQEAYVGERSFVFNCVPCTLRRKARSVTAEYITEGCYGAYDAVLFMSDEGKIFDVIPIEAKGNTDILDERLREQIWIAVKNYGKSLLLLDNEQAFKVKKYNLHKYLPCEIWFFNGTTFEQMTEPIIRSYSTGEPEISARAIERATGIHEYSQLRILRQKVRDIYSLLAALAYNQWNWKDERKFTSEEAQLFYELIGVPITKHKVEQEIEEKTIRVIKTLIVERKTTIQKSLFENQLEGSSVLTQKKGR